MWAIKEIDWRCVTLQALFVYIYTLPWYKLMLLIPAIVVLYALAVIILKKIGVKSKAFWSVSFIIWIIVVLFATLHRQSDSETVRSFQPLFQSYIDAQSNSESYRQNFLNVVLFFPGGLFLQSLFPARWSKVVSIVIPTLLLGVLSFVIELIQLYYNLGLAQMDDILHNTIGALLGAIGALVVTTLLNKITSKEQE